MGKMVMVVPDFHSDFQLLDLSVAVTRLEIPSAVQNSWEAKEVTCLLYCFLVFIYKCDNCLII